MIQFIVLGLMGIGALSDAMKKKKPSIPSSRPTMAEINAEAATADAAAARQAANLLFKQKLKNWREAWEPTVNRTQWIGSDTVARIRAAYPTPVRLAKPGDMLRSEDQTIEKLKAEFKAHNEKYLATQKERLKDFFDTVEKNPLTEEQIKACVCMDHHVQIVAAAGSGKTSTMVAKAGYTLREGLAQGNQILLLAFNANAAKELAERTQERLASLTGASEITAKTFHKFGLDVIGKATGKKPSLAPWLDYPGDDVKMIVGIINELCEQDRKFRHDWDLYRTVFGRDVGNRNEVAEPDAYSDGRYGFRTAQGEVVKSKEERQIADWLFYRQITYEYERPYEHETATDTHSQYKPDFYYPDIALYHEHFALDASGKAPDHFGADYTEGVRWKRQLHESYGTKLFETASYQIRPGVAIKRLEEELVRSGIQVTHRDREAPGAQPLTPQEFAGTFRVFQQHVKCNGLSNTQLRSASAAQGENAHTDRLARFIDLYERISAVWDRKLKEGQCIDFEDMLLLAAEYTESGRFQNPYTLILADEFQDSSRARIRLLKALANQNSESTYLCVVGDDWQGINRFAGADISVMPEFEKIFPFATLLSLGTTFRCPQKLCDISSTFIQANPIQIKKQVSSSNRYKTKKYVLAYAFEDESRAQQHLVQQFDQIEGNLKAQAIEPGLDGRISVLLLGRYKSDCPVSLRQWQHRYRDCLNIDFKTVHSSKGLEADYVMILNVIEAKRGFPSQIEDDPVLQLAMPAPDPFPMSEERRLFYVALTRARRQVRIYTDVTHPSRFLLELAKNAALVIEPIDSSAKEMCRDPKCAGGVLTLKTGRYGAFIGCSKWPKCRFTKSVTTISSG